MVGQYRYRLLAQIRVIVFVETNDVRQPLAGKELLLAGGAQ